MADAEQLRRLHLSHLRAVPFENLSVHLAEPISLVPSDLADKILRRGRGGFCYELNGVFSELLAALGYQVTLLAARVWGGAAFGPPFDHLALRVDCPDPWLVDVGFGEHSSFPLRLDRQTDQADPDGTFRLVPTDDGDVDVVRNGIVQYRLESRPRALVDFEAMCWWHQTSLRSHFTQTVVCTRKTVDGRVTLSGNRLIRTSGGERTEETLAVDSAVLDAYRRVFAIDLPRVPIVQAR